MQGTKWNMRLSIFFYVLAEASIVMGKSKNTRREKKSCSPMLVSFGLDAFELFFSIASRIDDGQNQQRES